MIDVQNLILRWRYEEGTGIIKTTLGWWMKVFHEMVIMIGLPVFVFFYVVENVFQIAVQTLPGVPNIDIPLFVIWICVCAFGELKLICMLSTGTKYAEQSNA